MTTLLVIDDDADFTQSIKSILVASGYSVETALNGNDGIRLAKQVKPALILLDVMMTYDTEGLDTARRLHEDPTTRTIPILCITGIHVARDLNKPLLPDLDWLPVESILEKPVKPEKLLKTIAELLRA